MFKEVIAISASHVEYGPHHQSVTPTSAPTTTPFLQAIARPRAACIRADNKRLTRVTQQYSASARSDKTLRGVKTLRG